MAVTLVVNGTGYSFPNTGDESWGDNVTNWATAVSSSMLQKTGGTFTLSAEVYFGASYGLKSLYYKSTGTNIAAAGVVRLANLEKVSWRNAANGADLPLSVNASDQLTYNGVAISSSAGVTPVAAGGTGLSSYTIGDMIWASAATTFSKLAIGTINYVMLSTGSAPSWGQIVDASVATGAAIARSKIASGTNYRILANSSAGVMSENAAITSTHVVYADANGQLAGEATLSKSRGGAGADMSTVTFPSSGTIVTTTGVQVLTLKDYDGGTASNTNRHTFPKDTLANLTGLTRKQATVWYASDVNKLYKDDGSSLTEIGSGSGGINYIGNPDAEGGTTGWATYADAAAATPVDGTGGSPNVTWTQSASSPLRGTNNFLLTKDAANRQGQGASYDFTIASADKAKPLNISFEYAVSANAVAGSDSVTGDINVYIYDVTNAVVIQPAPYKLPGGTGYPWKYSGTFQTASNSTSYRLILHVAGTNASATTYQFDNVIVGPQILMYGAPVSDWTSFTPLLTTNNGVNAVTLNATAKTDPWGWYRRAGDSVEIRVGFSNGSAGAATGTAGNLEISLPSGIVPDLTKMTSNSQTGYVVGVAQNFILPTAAQYAPDEGVQVVLGAGLYRLSSWKPATNSFATLADIVANTSVNYTVRFPVSGWGSNTVMSQDSDTRVVSANYTGTGSAGVNNGSYGIIDCSVKTFDTHNAVTTGASWKFTAPVAGYYDVFANVVFNSIITAQLDAAIYKNGSEVLHGAEMSTGYSAWAAGVVQMNAGDYVDIRVSAGQAGLPLTGVRCNISVRRLSGPATIAASETVACRYSSTAGTTLTKGANNAIAFATKDYDTHGAFVTDTFTCPSPGKYSVKSSVTLQSGATWANGDNLNIEIWKNGAVHSASVFAFSAATSGTPSFPVIVGTVSCLAGDTIKINCNPNKAAAGNVSMSTNAGYCYVAIERVGN